MQDRLNYFLICLVEIFADELVDLGNDFPLEGNHSSAFCKSRLLPENLLELSGLENANFWLKGTIHQ